MVVISNRIGEDYKWNSKIEKSHTIVSLPSGNIMKASTWMMEAPQLSPRPAPLAEKGRRHRI
jgi:hypothetical protein